MLTKNVARRFLLVERDVKFVIVISHGILVCAHVLLALVSELAIDQLVIASVEVELLVLVSSGAGIIRNDSQHLRV